MFLTDKACKKRSIAPTVEGELYGIFTCISLDAYSVLFLFLYFTTTTTIYFIYSIFIPFIYNLFIFLCSGGDELNNLILSDLYYHLQGELEGRSIGSGAFRELSLYLIDSEIFHFHKQNYEDDIFVAIKDAHLFDLVHIQADLGLDLWDYSEWKESKSIAARMLSCMEDVNSMILVTRSKLTALRALITILTLMADDVSLEHSDNFFINRNLETNRKNKKM